MLVAVVFKLFMVHSMTDRRHLAETLTGWWVVFTGCLMTHLHAKDVEHSQWCFCRHRWLVGEWACVCVCALLPIFQNMWSLPDSKTKSFDTVKPCDVDPLLPLKLSFFQSVANWAKQTHFWQHTREMSLFCHLSVTTCTRLWWIDLWTMKLWHQLKVIRTATLKYTTHNTRNKTNFTLTWVDQ